jgi:3-dehydroquinate dehydratase/shikimate dehydrogenase
MGFPDTEKLLEHAHREVTEGGERFLEFRLDFLRDPLSGLEAIRSFMARHPDCSVMATCRRHQNHGKFNGSIEDQLKVLNAAVEAGAVAVDVEIESAENAVTKTEALSKAASLIVSFHNYESTPAMESVLKRMMRVRADAYKLVTMARKASDTMRVLALARSYPKVPLILLCMGETGQATRVLAPAYGSVYTYAAPMSAEGTAAGQMSARVMRNTYRLEKFTAKAKVYAVIGDPVRQSISPAVHNRAFQAKRIDAVYLPYLVAASGLKDFMGVAENLPISGFSVTIPNKQKILRYLDAVEPLAQRIGAVNTVWKKAGKWRGTNTDAAGVLGPLSKVVKLNKASVLVAGNGGAARGAAFALADGGATLAITGRNIDRVRVLAKAVGAEALTREQAEERMFDAVINATPLGMAPNTEECFFQEKIPGHVVFDMVYNPLETRLTAWARSEKRIVVDGLQMFLEQARHQFEIWTGESAPVAQMLKAAEEALLSKWLH